MMFFVLRQEKLFELGLVSTSVSVVARLGIASWSGEASALKTGAQEAEGRAKVQEDAVAVRRRRVREEGRLKESMILKRASWRWASTRGWAPFA
jgi:hypothetical protein